MVKVKGVEVKHPGEKVIEMVRGKKPKDLALNEIVQLLLCGDVTVCIYFILLTSNWEEVNINNNTIKHARNFTDKILLDMVDRYIELWGEIKLIEAILNGEVCFEIRHDIPDAL